VDTLTIPGRYLVVEASCRGRRTLIHNLYAPCDSTGRINFYSSLARLEYPSDAQHIVLGDLNLAVDPAIDSASEIARDAGARADFLRWCAAIGVTDAWRVHHPDTMLFSGPIPRCNRLDYILLDDGLMTELYSHSEYFVHQYGGDHLVHSVRLKGGSSRTGTAFWRMDTSLLEYPDVCEAIANEAGLLLETIKSSANPGIVWDSWKRSTRANLQRIERTLRRHSTEELRRARELVQAADAHHVRVHSADSLRELDAALAVLKFQQQQLGEIAQDRGLEAQINDMETSSRRFFRPPRQERRTPIVSAALPDGRETDDPELVASVFRRHWGTIFGDVSCGTVPTAPDLLAQTELLDSISRRLPTEKASSLDAEISAPELAATIRHIKSSSAPGPDGLPAAFYKVAPDTFAEILKIVFRYQFTRGVLLPSQRKTAVTLLHKGGSRADPGNYRPISLMQVDTKILTKTLTYRLRSSIGTLVHQDQKGFISGRSPHHHVRFLNDLQHQVTLANGEGVAIFLDFAKAYDLVDWNYMRAVLGRMGFGARFQAWISIIYKATQALLDVNNKLLTPITPTRGVKQGDPLSVYLFLLCIEPLGNLLRARPDLGIEIAPGKRAAGLFFADDSTLLARSIAAAETQLDLVDKYCAGSGAKLNVSKSNVLALNREAQPPRVGEMRTLARGDQVKFLGIVFGQEDTSASQLARIDRRLLDRLRMWRHRARTIRGRLLIAQAVVFSVLWYFTCHLDIPEKTVRRWQALLENFVLYRRTDPSDRPVRLISREFSHMQRSKGGLGIPNLATFLRQQRISLLQQYAAAMVHESEGATWTTPAESLILHALHPSLPCQPLDLLSMSFYRHRALVAMPGIPAWWRSVWKLWSAIQWPKSLVDLPDSTRDAHLLSLPMWYSSYPLLHVQQSSDARPRCLGQIVGAQRLFRLQLAASHNVRCLLDFFDGADALPNRWEFMDRFLAHGEVATPVWRQRKWLESLYDEVRQLADRIVEPATSLAATRAGPHALPTLPVGVQQNDHLHLFPRLPPSALRSVFKIAMTPRRRVHPLMDLLGSRNPELVNSWRQFDADNRRLLLPVYHDLQLRLAFRLLPVGCRFSFLQHQRSDIMCCPFPGCNAVETEKHLFFECGQAAELWRLVGRDWRPMLGRTPNWKLVVNPQAAQVPQDSDLDPATVRTVWYIFRAIVLHQLWTQRNALVFDKHQPRNLAQHVLQLYSTFAAHLRHLRRIDTSAEPKLDDVINTLRSSGSGGVIFDRFPRLLATRDVTRLIPLDTIRSIFGHTSRS